MAYLLKEILLVNILKCVAHMLAYIFLKIYKNIIKIFDDLGGTFFNFNS